MKQSKRDAKIDEICSSDEVRARLPKEVPAGGSAMTADELLGQVRKRAKAALNTSRRFLKKHVERCLDAEIDRSRSLVALRKLGLTNSDSIFDACASKVQESATQIADDEIPVLVHRFVADTLTSLAEAGFTGNLQDAFDEKLEVLKGKLNTVDSLCKAESEGAVYDFVVRHPRYYVQLDASGITATIRSLSIEKVVASAGVGAGEIVWDTSGWFFAKLLTDIEQVARYAKKDVLRRWLASRFNGDSECEDWCSDAVKAVIEALQEGRFIEFVRTYLATVAMNIAGAAVHQYRPEQFSDGDDPADICDDATSVDGKDSLPPLDPTLGEQIVMCVEKLPDQPCDAARPTDGDARMKTIFKLRVGKNRIRKRVVAVILRLDAVTLCERTITRRTERAKELIEKCVRLAFPWWTYPRKRTGEGE